jgi:hypothetical protein
MGSVQRSERPGLQVGLTSAIVAAGMLRWPRPFPTSSVPMILVVLALVGFLLSGASIPHSHAPGHPGLYNQEHDLSYLATFGGGGPLPDAPFAVPLVVVVVLAVAGPAGAPPIVWRRHADFRAPPLP